MTSKVRRSAILSIAALAAACAEQTPRADVTPFSIGAIADVQYADKDGSGVRNYRLAPTKLKEAVGVLNEFDLEFVVHLGDFIEEDYASFAVLNEITNELRHPIRHVLGNHDFHVADADKPRVPDALSMPDRYYSFEHGDWVFVIVDGNDISLHRYPDGSPGHQEAVAYRASLPERVAPWQGAMGEEQLQWFDRVLSRADRKGKRVVVFSHFPLYPEHELNLWNAEETMALFERHASAVAWIAGHNHEGNYAERNGVHYVTLKAMLDTERNSFSIIEFDDDRLSISGFGREDDLELALIP